MKDGVEFKRIIYILRCLRKLGLSTALRPDYYQIEKECGADFF